MPTSTEERLMHTFIQILPLIVRLLCNVMYFYRKFLINLPALTGSFISSIVRIFGVARVYSSTTSTALIPLDETEIPDIHDIRKPAYQLSIDLIRSALATIVVVPSNGNAQTPQIFTCFSCRRRHHLERINSET